MLAAIEVQKRDSALEIVNEFICSARTILNDACRGGIRRSATYGSASAVGIASTADESAEAVTVGG